MDPSESDHGLATSQSHHIRSQRNSDTRDSSEELEHSSSEGHERNHALHSDLFDKATVTEEEDIVFSATRDQTTNPLMSTTHFKQAIAEIKERISLLEMKIACASSNEDHTGFLGDISATNHTHDVTLSEGGVKDALIQHQMIPEVYGRSWSDFMNKYAGEKYEYAIEALVGEPEYHHQHSRGAGKIDRRQGDKRSLRPESEVRTNLLSSQFSGGTPPMPERIRINSPWILNILAGIDDQINATSPVVMLRPFKFLVHYENQIKDSIRVLADQLAGTEITKSPNESAESSTSKQWSKMYQPSMIPQDIEKGQLSLEHMRCLTEFIDRYIKPTIDRLQKDSDGKIQFTDLWYLFTPGEDVYMPLRLPREPASFDAMATTPELFQDRYEMRWRVTGTGGGRPNLSTAESRNVDGTISNPNPFKVNCYYIDFDGKYFCPTIRTFSIAPFKGERDITSLDFFPVRFLKSSWNILNVIQDQGRMVFDNISTFKHYYYAGPTLVVHPCGRPIQDQPLHQEHIESEVIVDFRETLIKNPAWHPKEAALWKDPPVEQQELQEMCPVRYWNDRGRAKLENTEHDRIYDDYYIDKEIATNFRNKEQIFAPIPSGWLSNENVVPEKDLALLCGRVFAFVLRTCAFAPLWLFGLRPIKPQTEGLRNLQLRDNSFKETVQTLVRTHFIQKDLQQKSEFEYDVVRGKGKGLVILLHGAPGVGKTLTAESVAAANGKPLFQITCGELGMTPEEVGKALKEIFRFAQLWNCILLLDEADVFLAQRSKNDIIRNSLVSVFLRVLEYYTGVLFLTTNRVGALDDAFKSRITWSALYPTLNWEQTKNIWKANIGLLAEKNMSLEIDRKGILKFAKEHFKSCNAKGFTWNGRQIQNAFKVATALAEWDAYSKDVEHDTDSRLPEEKRSQRRLLASHFKTIADGTLAFERYLQETTGYTGGERAYNAMDRADNYDESNANDSSTVPQNNDRNQFFPTTQWQQRSTLAPTQPFRDPSPRQAHPRSSNQPSRLPNSMPSPRSRRSSQQPAAALVDTQSPHINRASGYASHTNTAKATNISSRAARHRHRSSSNSVLADASSQGHDEKPGDGSTSSSSEESDDLYGEHDRMHTTLSDEDLRGGRIFRY